MTRIHDFGESFEMYLKTVDELRESDQAIPITAVAERLGVATVSASEMIHRLQDAGLVHHQPYKGVLLTDQGQQAADVVVRAHRLWERFLVDRLGLGWAESHAAACDLEHVSSEGITDALDEFLGRPERCPHGNRIPRLGRSSEPDILTRLSDLEAGQEGVIDSIRPESIEVLLALEQRGLLPGAEFVVQEIEVLDGPRTLVTAGEATTIGRPLASFVQVALVPEVEVAA